jgi:hypothetical protein
MPCKVTNIIICTHEPVPCVIGSTLNGAVTESNEMTVGNLFKSFKEAPGKLLSRFGVGAEEIEMDSLHPVHTFLFLLDFPLYTWVLVR